MGGRIILSLDVGGFPVIGPAFRLVLPVTFVDFDNGVSKVGEVEQTIVGDVGKVVLDARGKTLTKLRSERFVIPLEKHGVGLERGDVFDNALPVPHREGSKPSFGFDSGIDVAEVGF